MSGFSEQEREAMKQRAAELKKEGRRGEAKEAAEAADVLAKISEMPEPDKTIAERVHAIVTSAAPDLKPKLWYSQPAYARDGKAVVFFRSGQGDKERYSTLGFSVQADLDDPSGFWPTAYALTEINAATEKQIEELVRKAVG